jgi:hypothetical protein
MSAGRDTAGNLRQMTVHRVGVGLRQHEGGADRPRRTDRTKQISPGEAAVAGRSRPRAAARPQPGQRSLLTDAGFVLKPDLDRFAGVGNSFREGDGDERGKVFLTAPRDRSADAAGAPTAG